MRFVLLILFSLPLSAANSQRIAVLYPESSSRASVLYSTIIQSMQERVDVLIQPRQLAANDSVDDIKQWLAEQKSQAVILLGKKGLRFSLKLTLDIPVITGAHIGVQPNHSAVSLMVDPEQLFRKLKKLEPDIQQVHVIYNEANSGWLIKKARLAAKKNKIKLNAIHTGNIQESGQALKHTIQHLSANKDAIWLSYDPILPVKPLLPDLLRKSWQKKIIIFSCNPSYVQQGALFALFPDSTKVGQQLIDLALSELKKNGPVHFEPSHYLNSAINIRTAAHLGIQLSNIQKDNYLIVFPKD